MMNSNEPSLSQGQSSCNLCPRMCSVDRTSHIGYCGETSTVRLARAALHHWEEPCISGDQGSGAIFFCGCNLRCVFCQNHDISCSNIGKEVTATRLCDIMLDLQKKGALNINLVTPTHFVPQIVSAIQLAKSKGLALPIVYNTSAYENVSTLKMLDGIIDIYLPDFKYYDNSLALRFSSAPNYREVALDAIDEMMRQMRFNTSDSICTFDNNGIMTHGIIVRHLVLPGHTHDSMDVLATLHARYGNDIYISIMNQYTPLDHVLKTSHKELHRKVTKKEYEKIIDYAIDIGIENGFTQEGEAAAESFIPAFDYEGV